MAIPSFSSTVVARAAAAIYGLQLGNGTMNQVLAEASNNGGVEALINAVYNRDYANVSNANVAAMVVSNMGITGDGVADAVAYVQSVLDGAGAANEGAAIASAAALFAGLTADPVYGAAATAFNNRISTAVAYAQQAGTADRAFTAGATIAMTAGQDFLTGTGGNDTIIARIIGTTNAMTSGDWVDGGAGADRLEADLGNPGYSITPETVRVETVAIRAQSQNTDSGDNNVSGESRVIVDAQRMSDVTRFDSNESRADLIIEDVRNPGRTKDVTIGMIGTDAGNVDYAVYFDRLRAEGTSTATLSIELMDTRAATSGDPAISALPLKDSPYNGFTFTVNGRLIRLTDDVANSTDPTTFNGAQTYPQLLAAIQSLLTKPANLALYPELAGITASLGPTFEARDTLTGAAATGTTIVLTGSSGSALSLGVGNFIADDGVPADSGLHTRQSPNVASATDLITSTVILDDVGRGSNGGDLVIGAMSVGETSSSQGVARFEVTVERASALGIMSSTNNALKEVVVTSGEAKGTLRVQGFDNTASLNAGSIRGDNNNVLPGATNAHNAYGFTDVRLVDMKGMTAGVTYDAQITGASFSKYIQVTDTQPDPAGDNTSTVGKTTLQVADFKFSGGSANDSVSVVIDAGVAASSSTVQVGREDATLVVEGMAGNDSLNVRIGNGLSAIDVANQGATRLATAAETGNDGLINATGLIETWYQHQKVNRNITVDAGEGNDTVRTPGAGDMKILLGAGNDTAYVDNTGFQNSATSVISASGRALWVFNTADQAGADDVAARVTNDIKSDTTLDTHFLYRSKITVTFLGLTASVDLPVGTYAPTDLHINQAIKKAINEDAVLSKLLVAEDGPLYSLVVKSLIDGVKVDADLGVAVTALPVTQLSAAEKTALAAAFPALTLVVDGDFTTAYNNAATAFNAVDSDYDGKLGTDTAATALVGANSTTPSDNTITPGTGNDVMVLGTTSAAAAPESSNDTVVYTNATFDTDTIVHFTAGVAATGGDVLDLVAMGGRVAATGTQLTAIAGTAAGSIGGAQPHRSINVTTEGTGNDTAAEVAAIYANDGAATTDKTHIYIAVSATDTSVAKLYRIVDVAGATVPTATLMGTIDLANVAWTALTIDNFA